MTAADPTASLSNRRRRDQLSCVNADAEGLLQNTFMPQRKTLELELAYRDGDAGACATAVKAFCYFRRDTVTIITVLWRLLLGVGPLWRNAQRPSTAVMRFVCITAALAAIGVPSACGPYVKRTYDEPSRNEQVEGHVWAVSSIGSRKLFSRPYDSIVKKIDNIERDFFTARFAIRPGPHTAEVRIQRDFLCWDFGCIRSTITEQEIDFSTKEGNTYLILGYQKGEQVYVWVHELETNKIVAGTAPPDLDYSCSETLEWWANFAGCDVK